MDDAAIQHEMDLVLSNGNDNANVLAKIDLLAGNSMESKLAKLNECKCCYRHQTNKPKTYTHWYDCKSETIIENQSFLQCGCNCRHMARWICRTCIDETLDTQ